LKSKYQNLQDDYKHLMDSHQKIEHEYKNYLQEVQFQHENAKKADQFINCVKTLMRDFEKIDDGNKDLEAKYFSLMDYFKFRGNRYYLTPVQTGKMHSILQKKSKDTGFEMRKIMMNGIEEITYHSYVLRISLGF
jgi:predicted RNase H-like nuclease (RuvC/YqgF family)